MLVLKLGRYECFQSLQVVIRGSERKLEVSEKIKC